MIILLISLFASIAFLIWKWASNWIKKNAYTDFIHAPIPENEMQKSLTEYRTELFLTLRDWLCEVPLFPMWVLWNKLRHGQSAKITAEVLRMHFGWLSQPKFKRLHCHGSDLHKERNHFCR